MQNNRSFGSKPEPTTCQYCANHITTRTEHSMGGMSGALCCFAFFFGGLLFCLPLIICGFAKDVNHYCPICGKEVGKYNRSMNGRIALYMVMAVVWSVGIGLLYYFVIASNN